MRNRKGTVLLFALYALMAAASLWLRGAFPAMAISGATHDDFLFVRQAYHLGAAQWLGPYDNLTLAKGMGFPAFILASFLAGLPLKLAEQIVYLAAAGLAAWVVARMSGRRLLGLALFAALAFNPVLWSEPLARVVREGLYASLSLALIALLAGGLFGRHWGWCFLPCRLSLFIAAGLVGGVFWLTREEGVWLAPAVAVLVLGALVSALTSWHSGERRLGARIAAAASTGVIVSTLVAVAVVVAVAYANQRAYGLFADNEFKSRGFLSAYGALARIQHPHEPGRRTAMLPKDAREKAYAVSAAARELKSWLDGELGEAWRVAACTQTNTNPCPEILSGWFMWALRDAVAAAGHYGSGASSDAFYRRLAAEINVACDDGRLQCLPPRASLATPFRWRYVADAIALVPGFLRILVTTGNGQVGAGPSSGLQFRIDMMAELVGPVTMVSPVVTTIVGNIDVTDAPPMLAMHDSTTASIKSDLIVRPSGPLTATGQPKMLEFELTTDCKRPTCELIVGKSPDQTAIPLASITRGTVVNVQGYSMMVHAVLERGEGTARPIAGEKRRRLQQALARAIAGAYAVALPILAGLALAGFIAASLLQPSRRPGLFTLGLACIAAVATRIALLAYLDVTSIPAVNLLYLSPATPFFLTFVVLGLYCGLAAIQSCHVNHVLKD